MFGVKTFKATQVEMQFEGPPSSQTGPQSSQTSISAVTQMVEQNKKDIKTLANRLLSATDFRSFPPDSED